MEPILTRLEQHKKIDPNTGCWLWTAQLSNVGYGNIWFNGATYSVHRVSAHLYLGLDINDDNVLVLHKRECPNRHCFNPDHLYLGNQKDNQADAVALKKHRNSRKTHCHRGHLFDKITVRSSGKIIRVCSICAKERDSKRWDRRKK